MNTYKITVRTSNGKVSAIIQAQDDFNARKQALQMYPGASLVGVYIVRD